MDGVSAAASVIAIVQAGGMLWQVGKAFHETFITKDNDQRGEDAALRVASIGEFIQKIELFQAVKLISSPSVPGLAIPSTSAPNGQGLDSTLDQCKEQLRRLQAKTQKMVVPPGASKMKRFTKAIRLKLNEPEFAQIESTVTVMLQQLDLLISLANFQISQDSHVASQERHTELMQEYQAMEARIQDATRQGTKNQENLLADLQKKMEERQMQLDTQMSAFEQSNQMILTSFEKLTISPRLDRSTSGLSGTTVATDTEVIDDEDLIAPIAPGLMKHPGFGFREDRLPDPKVAKILLDRVDHWLDLNNEHSPSLCIRTTGNEDAMYSLCNRTVQEVSDSGLKLLCYNGLPRDGAPPAPGWYTITHAIWWLSGQLLIPIPHKDGHMPPHGYVPNIEAIIERCEKSFDTTTYVVLYLLTKSCPTDSDRRLYELLVSRIIEISSTSNTRLLLFTDEQNDTALVSFPPNTVIDCTLGNSEGFSLVEWDPRVGYENGYDEDGDADNDDDQDDENMSI